MHSIFVSQFCFIADIEKCYVQSEAQRVHMGAHVIKLNPGFPSRGLCYENLRRQK